VPFGEPVRIVLHRVLPGDSVTLYARRYDTSPEAILAINHELPVPLHPDWVLVIPLGTTAVYGLPPFETYHAGGIESSPGELAARLGADLKSISRYNGFEGPCGGFAGWLLVPRPPSTLE
jgi:hypothetical protein